SGRASDHGAARPGHASVGVGRAAAGHWAWLEGSDGRSFESILLVAGHRDGDDVDRGHLEALVAGPFEHLVLAEANPVGAVAVVHLREATLIRLAREVVVHLLRSHAPVVLQIQWDRQRPGAARQRDLDELEDDSLDDRRLTLVVGVEAELELDALVGDAAREAVAIDTEGEEDR